MLTCDALSMLPGILHGFFSRQGGSSTGLYASLNCGPGSGDDPARVEENRQRVAAAFGLPPEALVTLAQVHGKEVVRCRLPATRREDSALRATADALVTDRPGILLGILSADCAPVLFAEPEARVIGAAHAGWKGALAGVLEATVAAMEDLGAERERIQAAIGPSIGLRSYEVGEEFRQRLREESEENSRFFEALPNFPDKGKAGAETLCFDLRGYVAAKLANAGVTRIDILMNDTCAEEAQFFSYRRATLRGQKDYGRQISCIVLE